MFAARAASRRGCHPILIDLQLVALEREAEHELDEFGTFPARPREAEEALRGMTETPSCAP